MTPAAVPSASLGQVPVTGAPTSPAIAAACSKVAVLLPLAAALT
eukprot:gene10534-4674_t